MAIVMMQEMTEASVEQYDQIAAKLNPDENPPEGLIVHAAGQREGGGMRIVDVWESEDAYNRFREQRLGPVVREVIGEQAGPPEHETFEVHHLVHP